MSSWKEWWGESTSGPRPTGYVEVRDARGVTRKGSAGGFQ